MFRAQINIGSRWGSSILFGLWLLSTLSVSALSGDECLTVSRAGSVGEVRSMLTQHTMTELFRVRDEAGRGLLHLCLRRSEEFWKTLVDAGWLVKQEKGWTPIHEAALLGNLEAIKAMKAAGGNLSGVEPVNGGTPLHVAAFNGHLEIVQYLVNSGVKVNARDNDGWTALSQARDQGFPAIVDWLKKNGGSR